MEGITRVYERGKTRLQTSSWVASTPKYQYCLVVSGVEGSDAQSHVLDDECSVGKFDSGKVLESNLLTADGHVDDDACDRNRCPVVRGNANNFCNFQHLKSWFIII